jgi:Sulfotransferase family
MFDIPIADSAPEDCSESILLSTGQRFAGGLADWGGEAFFGPLRMLLRSNQNLNRRGRQTFHNYVVRLLTNRLRIQRELNRLPEIFSIRIPSPIFITGLARSGTTLLHNLLALDARSRTLRLWEVWWPTPTVDRDGKDTRLADSIALWSWQSEVRALHSFEPDGPEECQWLLEHEFAAWSFAMSTHRPEYLRWYVTASLEEQYRFHKRAVQLIRSGSGDAAEPRIARMIFKAPSHLGYLDTILRVYPEARFIQLHRNPVEAFASSCNMVSQLRQALSTYVSPREVYADVATRVFTYLERSANVRRMNDQRIFLDVYYEDLIRDPVSTVSRIYEWLGEPVWEQMERKVSDYIRANPKGKHGTHRYAIEDFGANSKGLAQELAFYIDTFNIPMRHKEFA